MNQDWTEFAEFMDGLSDDERAEYRSNGRKNYENE